MGPLQEPLVPRTVIFPDTATAEKVTVIEFVLEPAVIVAPDGSDHVQPVAFVIEATEYVTPVCPWQTLADPAMDPGIPTAGFTVIVIPVDVAEEGIAHEELEVI